MSTVDVDPSDASLLTTIFRLNPSVFEGDRDCLLGAEWLLKDPGARGKARSTLVLTVASEAVADRIILSALALGGGICCARKWLPSVLQCHFCL